MVYNTYSDFLSKKFGEKVYKLPIKLDLTCPNRDGTCGSGGCIFCGEKGGSFENKEGSITEQIEKSKALISKKYKANKFIAYFQNFTNTYLDIEDFKKNIEESLVDDVVGISISTRPDCLGDEYLEYLSTLKDKYLITLEIGLQTVNYHTLEILNRGHYLSEFIDGVLRAREYGIRTCAHVILDLPWDDELDVAETAKILSALKVDEVKLHSLYIVKGTKLCELYEKNELELLTLEEYKRRVVLFLTNLNEKIVVQRIVGRAPEEDTVFCNYNTSWWKIRDSIIEYMQEKNLYQGNAKKG